MMQARNKAGTGQQGWKQGLMGAVKQDEQDLRTIWIRGVKERKELGEHQFFALGH